MSDKAKFDELKAAIEYSGEPSIRNDQAVRELVDLCENVLFPDRKQAKEEAAKARVAEDKAQLAKARVEMERNETWREPPKAKPAPVSDLKPKKK